MLSSPTSTKPRRSTFSVALISALRVLFTTLLFVAGGMALGLFLGIVGTVLFGSVRGGPIDMTVAYRHVAIPLAALCGALALVGSTIHELRVRREAR